MLSKAQELMLRLPTEYPQVISDEQVQEFLSTVQGELLSWGQDLLSFSVTSLFTVIYIGVYLILVPLLVFFMIRDKDKILNWFGDLLPENRALANEIWREVNDQIVNYVRGKVWEILIVGGVSYVVYALIGLPYALLLGALTGVSVLVPYVGAVVVSDNGLAGAAAPVAG